MLVSIVGCGTRAAFGCSKVCFSTVIRPSDCAAAFWNSAQSQSRAAPMPRLGLFCSDKVLRVPKLTSLRIVFSIFFGLISATILEICAFPVETALIRLGCFDWLTADVENENWQTRNTNT